MMKKILALVLVLALAAGVVAMTATAETTGSNKYQVGYSKVDINPYWKAYIDAAPEEETRARPTDTGYGYTNDYDMLPLPMGGYGNNTYRLSRGKLLDDNGSGYGMPTYNYTSNKITYDPTSTVVHLSDNRYSQEFAEQLFGGTNTQGYIDYVKWANIEEDGWGDNDGDGLWATAVFVEDATGSPLLILGVDNIGVSVDLIQEAKSKILAACKESCPELTADRILINSNHTHGGPSLGEDYANGSSANANKMYYFWDSTSPDKFTYEIGTSEYTLDPGPGFKSNDLHYYIDFYRHYLTDQLGVAAAAAVADKKTAENMYKGSIDAGEATGLIINGVRHNKQTYQEGDKPVLEYVRGSSFNVDLNGNGSGDRFRNSNGSEDPWSETIDGVTYTWTKAEAVTEGDDMLHLLKFTFPTQNGETPEPVILVNWRAHSTANNKQSAKALHYNLSADWGASLRYELEQTGGRVALLYGSSGNLGTGETGASSEEKAIPSDYPYYMPTEILEKKGISNDGKSRYMMPGVYYGKQVARAAKQLLATLNDGHIVSMDSIKSVQRYEILAKRDWTDNYYKAAVQHNALLKAGEEILYPWVYKSSAADYSTYDANGKVVPVSEEDETPVVIASQYHANHVKNKYESNAQSTIELNAVMLGSQVAFATTPVEASDRYFADAKSLDEVNEKDMNDWDKLIRDTWGTPFVLSLTNGSQGYVPNTLAYDYNNDYYFRDAGGGKTYGDYYTIAIGSYESQSTWAERGEGERIVTVLNSMLTTLETDALPQDQVFTCSACGEEKTFTALIPGHFQADNALPSGHYYLAEDFASRQSITINAGETVCLELNGKTFSSGKKAFVVHGTLGIQDTSNGTGILKGREVASVSGGTINVQAGAVVNQYSGKITCEDVADVSVSGGGVVYVAAAGQYNMYAGEIYGGHANGGGNVEVVGVKNGDGTLTQGEFNMFDGTIFEGTSTMYGGNVQVQAGIFNMYGGAITGGTATSGGANLIVSRSNPDKGTFRYAGGSITSGTIIQGDLILGSDIACAASAVTSKLRLQNGDYTVTVNGVFTGKVELYYYSGTQYTVANGNTIGAVDPGSWIDHVNGAKITAKGVSGYEGVVSGRNLILGTTPTAGHCDVCGTDVNWVTLESNMFYGHYMLNQALTDMEEKTIPAGNPVCLNLNGNTYTAAARAFTVNGTLNIQDTEGGGTLQGTAVDGKDGGTVLVKAGGSVNQHSGILTCQQAENAKIASGGVVYVESGGRYTLHNGTITGGVSSGTGGNTYVAAEGNFTMNNGSVTGGEATGNGGNVYTEGTFTLAGGSISGGKAKYGGNIQVQNATSQFTMTGGTVSGGTGATNICTSQSTLSNTRLQGGTIQGTVYAQGNLTLANTTYTSALDITVKEAGERLTIEGTCTGIINLTVSGVNSFAHGTKLGKATNNADISEATITVDGAAATQYVEIVEGELRMGGKVITGISVNTENMKTTYKSGEALDTTGLVVNHVYSNGSTEVIASGYTVTGYNPEAAGEQTLTVTYGGYTTTFNVYVKVLETIEVRTSPTKTVYNVDENLDITGLTLTATYDDGSTETIEEGFDCTDFDSSFTGTKTVTVEYEGCTTTFEVTIKTATYLYYVNSVGYTDLDKAMDDSSKEYPVVLNTDVGSITLSKNLYLDLNGHHVTNVTTGSCKLYCLDSATKDYDVQDGVYGTVTAGANIQAASDYLAVTEGDVISFHKYELKMVNLVVNPSEKVQGITYESIFRGDQKVKEQIKEFGVAMRAYNAPNATSIWADPECLTHVARRSDAWKTGNDDTELKSVYVEDILVPGLPTAENRARSVVPVYGRAYIELRNGTMLFSNAASFSMQEAMEHMNAWWDGDETYPPLDDEKKENLAAFYEEYEDVMSGWDIDRIIAKANETNNASQDTGIPVM